MPLRRLILTNTHFSDARVLGGMPLAELALSGGFTDPSTLVGLPLRSLR